MYNKLSDSDSVDYISVNYERLREKYSQNRILSSLSKCNIDYTVMDGCKTQKEVNVLYSPSEGLII
ncbi:hypothetical protein [Wolbachia pipientis]|uniref:hypothetical protein n=1 Tax=Wolbachia pipientis TaxID=955 RepID=UPI0025A4A3B0|nr:hypothetical protein [Wolbachia pipientis]MDM8335166.1 hypothetical protein [Wolbachia pipientis]